MDVSTQPTILIVNVPAGIEDYLRQLVGDRCCLRFAKNSSEMYQHLLRRTPDAIMTDWDLPKLSGADLVQGLRSHPDTKTMPFAIVTQNGQEAIARECQDAGASLVVEPSTPKSHVIAWFDRILADYEAKHSPPKLDQNMAMSMASATQEVMTTLLGIELTQGELKIEKVRSHTAEVISTIAVAGHVAGTITLFMNFKLAKIFAGRMLDEIGGKPTDEEIVDAIGEMTNMIAGNIKTLLCRREELFSMSPPSVVLGSEVRRVSTSNNLAFTLPCTCHTETLLIEFSLQPRRQAAPTAGGAVTSGVH